MEWRLLTPQAMHQSRCSCGWSKTFANQWDVKVSMAVAAFLMTAQARAGIVLKTFETTAGSKEIVLFAIHAMLCSSSSRLYDRWMLTITTDCGIYSSIYLTSNAGIDCSFLQFLKTISFTAMVAVTAHCTCCWHCCLFCWLCSVDNSTDIAACLYVCHHHI